MSMRRGAGWKKSGNNPLFWWRTKSENVKIAFVDEGRKRVLLIAASILAARKLHDWDGRPSPASESAIANAITVAERIMSKIDARWPVTGANNGRSPSKV
jgi:hypothetical protein